jgi:hypothetical protein
MMLLSNSYINQKSPGMENVKESFDLNYLLNICHLNNTHLKKVQIVKSIICPIIDFFETNKEFNVTKLNCLKDNLEKAQSMIVHGSPKLKKKIEEI